MAPKKRVLLAPKKWVFRAPKKRVSMAPKKRVSRGAGSSTNGAEINSQMNPSSGSKCQVRGNGSSSSSSSSVPFNVDENHVIVDMLIESVESSKRIKKLILTNLDLLDLCESDCEDEEEEEDEADGCNIEENGSSSFSSSSSMDELHLKCDRLIKLLSTSTSSSSSSSSSIPHTIDGFRLKVRKCTKLFMLETKKLEHFRNAVSTCVRKNGFEFGSRFQSELGDNDVEEEQDCVIN